MSPLHTVLDYAELYISFGFQVHPCRGKAPKVLEWQKKKLTVEQFRRIHQPGDNLGVVMGKSSGIVCIDIDPRNGGDIWYEDNRERLGEPVLERTGSGGYHLYYRYPQNEIVLKSRTGYAPGVDILADGGKQVITAPSIHPETQKPYELNDWDNLSTVHEVADFLPEWIVNDITQSQVIPYGHYPVPAPTNLIPIMQAVESFPPAIEGQAGDSQTLRAAFLCRDYGLDSWQAFELLKAHYNHRCVPPWDDAGLREKVQNAYSYAKFAQGAEHPENQFQVEEEVKERISPNSGGINSPKIVSFSELSNLEITPREHILGPFVKQGLSMIYAKPGVGKTHFAMGIAFAMATKTRFLNWQSECQCSVLYIDGELPAFVLKECIAPMKASLQTSIEPPLYFLTPDLQPDGLFIPDLATREGQEQIEASASQVEVIVVDNLSTVMRSYKENDADSWLPVQQWLLKLRKRGQSVILVHHAGKAEGVVQRGSSRKEDVLDLCIGLKRPGDYEAEQGLVFETVFSKSRHFRTASEIKSFEARYGRNEAGQLVWGYKPLDEKNSEKIIRLNDEGWKTADIVKETKLSRQYISKILKDHLQSLQF